MRCLIKLKGKKQKENSNNLKIVWFYFARRKATLEATIDVGSSKYYCGLYNEYLNNNIEEKSLSKITLKAKEVM